MVVPGGLMQLVLVIVTISVSLFYFNKGYSHIPATKNLGFLKREYLAYTLLGTRF